MQKKLVHLRLDIVRELNTELASEYPHLKIDPRAKEELKGLLDEIDKKVFLFRRKLELLNAKRIIQEMDRLSPAHGKKLGISSQSDQVLKEINFLEQNLSSLMENEINRRMPGINNFISSFSMQERQKAIELLENDE